MTDKIRIRPENHIIIEFVEGGAIVYNNTGTVDNQEDVCTHLYGKILYTTPEDLLEMIRNRWEEEV